MEDAVRLAVARLAESGEAACGCRLRAERLVEGYCLVAGGRLTLYVENGRTLTERSPEGLFYYEGWVLTGEGPVSLGVFNTGPAGDCSASCVVEGELLERAVGIRVTAEPHGGSIAGHRPVLDGRLIWLQQPERAPDAKPLIEPGPELTLALPPEADQPDQPHIQPTVERLPDAQWRPAHQTGTTGGGPPWSAVLSRAGAVAQPGHATEAHAASRGVTEAQAASAAEAPAPVEAPAEAPGEAGVEAPPEARVDAPPEARVDAPPEARVDAPPEARVDAPPEARVDAPPEARVDAPPEAWAEAPGEAPPVAGPPPDEPPSPEPDIPPYPEPATMVTTVVPVTRNVALSNVHPMAPRAVGAAVVRLREGQVTLTLRGLPAPPALGRDPATDRPFNAYRVWLLNQRTGQGTALGICERLWGESYRYQSAPGLVLTRHDTLLVTAGDRNEIEPTPHGARVLLGTFQGA